MPRRVRMPAADELFRSTVGNAALAPRPGGDRLRAVPDPVDEPAGPAPERAPARPARVREAARPSRAAAPRGASGRERHEEKITVYVSPEELLGLEQARIMLRAEHGLAMDRGRIVREALDLILADFAANGDESQLVRSLRGTH